ncbi:hypothetical protein [Bacteroides sp.]|uniref:hypothetical protein n=1 Tax=Bacteroides sp. TaxID=29523 RepID=UPI0026035787|nr:hypothetical protein [Bacteroides sp.]MDD3036926.1 hypothetical protein [Bacteroides sp.]
MEIETNKISEIYKGHYQVILDFPDQSNLKDIIDVSYKYVWGVEHYEIPLEWKEYNYSLYGESIQSKNIFARNIEMEFLLNTSDFLDLIPHIHQAVHIIQTNIVPPYYLNIKNLSGKGKYDLLKSKIDYLFELEMPGAIDYAPIISPDINYLKNLIAKLNK